MSSKQPKTTVPTDADLKGNPGIGQSVGTTAAGVTADDMEDLQGETTFEGDTANDTNTYGGINRTPKPGTRKPERE